MHMQSLFYLYFLGLLVYCSYWINFIMAKTPFSYSISDFIITKNT